MACQPLRPVKRISRSADFLGTTGTRGGTSEQLAFTPLGYPMSIAPGPIVTPLDI